MTGVTKESHQQQCPTRRPYSDLKSNSRGSTGGNVDTDINENVHGSVRNDTIVIEVEIGAGDSDLNAGSNIATPLKFGSLSSISKSA